MAGGCLVADRSVLHRFEQAGPLTWLLAACAGWALLLWLAALLGLGNTVAPTPTITADGALPKASPITPDRIGPLGQYAEAASRPVFTSDRRPRAFMATGPDGDVEGVQAQTLDFILTGILISPQVRLAILQPTGGGEAVRVREGSIPEGASGWRLVEVQPRRAIFQGGGGESTLDLRVFGEAANPVRRAAAATGASSSSVASMDDDDGPISAADAAARAAADATPISLSEAARIETIRKRIEARRSQMQGKAPDSRRPAVSSTRPTQ